MACNDFASLFFKTYDGAMAFLEIAFNTGGVQCFCIFFLKQTMAFYSHLLMVISWDHMNRQRFQQSRLVTPYNNHEKKMQNTLAKSNDFSS